MPQALTLLIEAGYPLVLIETADEAFAVDHVVKSVDLLQRPLYDWSITEGMVSRRPAAGQVVVPPGSAAKALEYVAKSAAGTVFLFRELDSHLKDPVVDRRLCDLNAAPDHRRPAVVILETNEASERLRRLSIAYEIKPPDLDELTQIVKLTFTRIHQQSLREITSKLTGRELEQLVRNLSGLSRSEAARVVASAVLDDHLLDADDLPRVVDAKRAILGRRGVLETIAVDVRPDDVGGLENLKRWLARRRDSSSRAAREFGLESPRGILLLGVQGCGKSLSAKTVAADWRIPLLRFDPGLLYQRFVGESERALREALMQAEAMSPVVLWIDEIEKAFASSHSASADGGLSQRMFGTFLTWLQDHRRPIFTVATANDVSALPPELLRKGRFDEVFFIDLPKPAVREKILAVHLARRRRDPAKFNLANLAAATEGFSGAEIEQLIVSAMFDAFAAKRDIDDAALTAGAAKTRPLSTVMAERVADLRAWAADRCVPADE